MLLQEFDSFHCRQRRDRSAIASVRQGGPSPTPVWRALAPAGSHNYVLPLPASTPQTVSHFPTARHNSKPPLLKSPIMRKKCVGDQCHSNKSAPVVWSPEHEWCYGPFNDREDKWDVSRRKLYYFCWYQCCSHCPGAAEAEVKHRFPKPDLSQAILHPQPHLLQSSRQREW